MANPFDQFDTPNNSGNPFDRFDAPTNTSAPASKSALGTAADIGKQLASGLAEGVEGIPATAPTLIGAGARGIDALIKNYAPGFHSLISDPEAEKRQQELQNVINSTPKWSISNYLPAAETGAGEAARMVGNFIPAAAGASGSIARNLVGATGAGLGAYGAGNLATSDEAKPYLEMAGALAGGAAGVKSAESVANRAFSKADPLASDIKNAATDTYKNLQAAGAAQPINQNELDNLATNLKTTLNKIGPRQSVAPGVHSAIEEIRTPGTAGTPDVADLVSARQNIKSFFQNPQPDPNKAGAAIILPQIDAAIERLSPGTMQQLKNADANYSSAMTANALDKRLASAELRSAGSNSGMNVGNKIRQNSASMLLSNKDSRGLTGAEEAALESVVRGTNTQNYLQKASRVLGGGGGLGTAAIGSLGVGGAYETGHPELAALPILGFGLRALENRSIAKQAANVSQMIRARSPYAQSIGFTPNTPLTDRNVAALASLLSLPAIRGLSKPPAENRLQ